MKPRTRTLLIAALVVILVAVGAYAAFAAYSAYFVSTVNPVHKAPGAATACGTTIPTTGLSTYSIVPEKTTASYRVHENLIIRNQPNYEAVGTTHDVQGTFQVRSSPSPLVAGMHITVDLRTLKTDEERRDHYIQENTLETSSYPNAEFVSTCAQGLPASYTDGSSVKFQMVGNLTLHGKTNKETFDVQGKLEGKTITGTASTTIFMTDFGIDPPNLINIAVAQNKVVIGIDFTATQT